MQLVPSDYFKKLPKEALFTEIDKPLEIDLGCGDGSFLVAMASKYPEKNFCWKVHKCRKVTQF